MHSVKQDFFIGGKILPIDAYEALHLYFWLYHVSKIIDGNGDLLRTPHDIVLLSLYNLMYVDYL